MTDNDTLQSNTVPTDPLIMDNMTEFNRVLSTQQARIVACHVRSSQSEQSMLGYTAAAAVMVTPRWNSMVGCKLAHWQGEVCITVVVVEITFCRAPI
jgi:hypothetical protein